MRLLFVVEVCLTLVFVVECLEGKAEFIEDEEEMDQRHLIKRVSSFTKGLWLYGFKKICKEGLHPKLFMSMFCDLSFFHVSCIKLSSFLFLV